MRTLIVAICFLATATAVMATTWHVAQDGSGDFTVIQDAVDGASAGDTIWIHAGRYTELTEDHDVWGNGSLIADVHVVIDKDDLTLLGDGPETTFIGSETPPGDLPQELYGISIGPAIGSTLTVTDLTIENVSRSIMAGNDRCEISNCHFFDFIGSGVWLYTPGGASIIDCRFVSAYGNGVAAGWPAADVSVHDCEFVGGTRAGLFNGVLGVSVRSCTVEGPNTAFNIQQGSTVALEDCELSGSPEDNYGLYVSMGAQATLTRCTIEGFTVGLYVVDGGDGAIMANDCSIVGSSGVCIWNFGGVITVHDSDIINGGGWSVMCHSSSNPDCHVDMTNNYWGTDSADQIAEWIEDSNDNPEDCCTVDFIPFDGPTPVESQSWSAVKGMFDGGGGRE